MSDRPTTSHRYPVARRLPPLPVVATACSPPACAGPLLWDGMLRDGMLRGGMAPSLPTKARGRAMGRARAPQQPATLPTSAVGVAGTAAGGGADEGAAQWSL